MAVLGTYGKPFRLVTHEGGHVHGVLLALLGGLVQTSVQTDLKAFNGCQRHAQAIVETILHLNLLVSLAIHYNGIGRKPIGELVRCRNTQVGTATELVLVLEGLHHIAVAPELFLEVELCGGDKAACQCQFALLPLYQGILHIEDTMVVVYLGGLAYVGHALHAQSLAQIVFVTQITSLQFKPAVVVLCTETRVQVGKHLDDGLTLGFFLHFGILGLCHDTHAGKCHGNNHSSFHSLRCPFLVWTPQK